MMRPIFVLGFLSAICLSVIYGSPQDRPQRPARFSISISLPASALAVGSPVHLTLTLENTSGGEINVPVSEFKGTRLRLMDIRVWNAQGEVVPETDYGKRIHARALGGWESHVTSGRFPLDAGKTITEESDLNKEFRLDKPGRYTVQAQRLDPSSRIQVQSNTVTFTIGR